MTGQQSTQTAAINDPNVAVQGIVTPRQLYLELKRQGFDPLTAAAFVAIAGRESGYNTTAESGDRTSTGDIYSTGLFQINLGAKYGPGGTGAGTPDIHGGQLVAAGLANPYSALQTLTGSVFGAKVLYAADGLQPWAPQGGTWATNTNLSNAAAASGGEVSVGQLMAISGSKTAGAPPPVGSGATLDGITGKQIINAIPFFGPLVSGGQAVVSTFDLVKRIFDNWQFIVEGLIGFVLIGFGVLLILHDTGVTKSVTQNTEKAAVAGAVAA